MASESTGGDVTSVSIPAELDEWLAQHAGALDTDRETVVIQLLSAYQEVAANP